MRSYIRSGTKAIRSSNISCDCSGSQHFITIITNTQEKLLVNGEDSFLLMVLEGHSPQLVTLLIRGLLRTGGGEQVLSKATGHLPATESLLIEPS